MALGPRSPSEMLDYLFFILCAIIIYFNTARTLLGLRWFRWLKFHQGRETFDAQGATQATSLQISIILPALEEQAIVDETLSYFQELESRENVTFIVVTSLSEVARRAEKRRDLLNVLETADTRHTSSVIYRLEGIFPSSYASQVLPLLKESKTERISHCLRLFDSVPTTSTLVKAWVERNPMFPVKVLEYPEASGGKGAKINYAFDILMQSAERPDWIGVYDFDSRPDTRTLVYLKRMLGENYSHIQQIPMPISDITGSEYLQTLDKILVRNEAVIHLQRSFGIEFNFFNRSQLSWLTQIRSFMGAGMFFNAAHLKPYLPFPDPIDDIPMGYRYQFALQDSAVLPVVNDVRLTSSLRQVKRQHLRIFYGALAGLNIEWKNSVQHGYFRMDRVLAFVKCQRAFWAVFGEMLTISSCFALLLLNIARGKGLRSGVIFLGSLYLGYGTAYTVFNRVAVSMAKSYYSTPVKPQPHLGSTGFLVIFSFFRGIFRMWTIGAFIVSWISNRLDFLATKSPR